MFVCGWFKHGSKNPPAAGLWLEVQGGLARLGWVRWRRVNLTGLNNGAHKSFHRDKDMTAIHVCALVVTLFCCCCHFVTTAGVRCMATQRASHHDISLYCIDIHTIARCLKKRILNLQITPYRDRLSSLQAPVPW